MGDVEEAQRFYRDVIGFEVQTQFPSAAFVSVGGYHHHLAFNTWRGEGVPPAPGDAVGLPQPPSVVELKPLSNPTLPNEHMFVF